MHEKPGQTLQATALVHDAYIRLVDVEKAQHWDSRGHFFAAAAEAMRRILVEKARRSWGHDAVEAVCPCGLMKLTTSWIPSRRDSPCPRCLEELFVRSLVKAELVKLRYFGGLSHQEAANRLG